MRTQIYPSKHEHDRLRRLAASTGRSQSELIRAAVDLWLEQQSLEDRHQILKDVAGIWRERTDLPDFAALRREADRVAPPERK